MAEDMRREGRLDADNLYKTVLKKYFWDGLKLFMSNLYADADTSAAPDFLDNEQQKAAFDLKGGAARTDILASVKLRNGRKKFVICHVEIQGAKGGNLPERHIPWMCTESRFHTSTKIILSPIPQTKICCLMKTGSA